MDKSTESAGVKQDRERENPNRVTSAELLRGKAELIIVHDGRDYRLRITQNGKLILTA